MTQIREEDRAKANELAGMAFDCAMAAEGYALPDAPNEDAVVEAIATALSEAYWDGVGENQVVW